MGRKSGRGAHAAGDRGSPWGINLGRRPRNFAQDVHEGRRAGAVGRHIDRCAVQTGAIDNGPDHAVLAKRVKQTVLNGGIRAAAYPDANGVPVAPAGWQSAPLAAVIRDIPDRIENRQVRNPRISAAQPSGRAERARIVLLLAVS